MGRHVLMLCGLGLALTACQPDATAQLTSPLPARSTTATSADQLFGLNKVGVREPSNHYQRYRRAEFPSDKGFYQWWFFTLRDVATQQYFTFTYSMMDAVTNPARSSARMMFSATDLQSGTRFRKSEVFPLAQLAVSNDFDVQLFSDAARSRAVHSIEALADGNWRIRGQMVAPPRRWKPPAPWKEARWTPRCR